MRKWLYFSGAGTYAKGESKIQRELQNDSENQDSDSDVLSTTSSNLSCFQRTESLRSTLSIVEENVAIEELNVPGKKFVNFIIVLPSAVLLYLIIIFSGTTKFNKPKRMQKNF